MLAASLNAFFCASPIYGSAEDFTFLLDVTVSREVTPAAKQQIGETRKKCNSDDRRLRRIQGGAVGAAVSRTRVPPKARSGRWVPQPVGSSASKSLVVFWFSFDIRREQLALMKKRSILRRRRKDHSSVICSPSSSARISAPVAGRLRTR